MNARSVTVTVSVADRHVGGKSSDHPAAEAVIRM